MEQKTLLAVSLHPSGRRTLTRKDPGEVNKVDLRGPLLANGDAGVFYKAVAKYISDLAASGVEFNYSDVE